MFDISVNKQSSIRMAGELTLYFDPWEIPTDGDADLVFVTHEHHDHFSPMDVLKAAKADTVFVAPASMAEKFLTDTGLDAESCLFVEPHKAYEVKGVVIEAVPAYNNNKQFHTRDRNWVGYVVTVGGTRYYVMGDTDDTSDARKVDCDVLLLPVGGTYTMTVDEAAAYAAAVAPQKAIPTHYGPVVGTAEDGKKFAAALQKLAPAISVEVIL